MDKEGVIVKEKSTKRSCKPLSNMHNNFLQTVKLIKSLFHPLSAASFSCETLFHVEYLGKCIFAKQPPASLNGRYFHSIFNKRKQKMATS